MIKQIIIIAKYYIITDFICKKKINTFKKCLPNKKKYALYHTSFRW